MNIFTEVARHLLRRTISSLANATQDVEAADFLRDEVIWAECWFLLEVTCRAEERIVPPECDGDTPVSLAGERLRSVFDTLTESDEIFDPEARTYVALLPHGSPWGWFKVDDQGKLLRKSDNQYYPESDMVLWRAIFEAALYQINVGDDYGFWFRNCFGYLEANGKLPEILVYKEEDE